MADQRIIRETESKPIVAAIESSYLDLVDSMVALRSIERSGWGNRQAVSQRMMSSLYALFQLTRYKLEKKQDELIGRIEKLMKAEKPNTKEAFELADKYQGALFNAGILSIK